MNPEFSFAGRTGWSLSVNSLAAMQNELRAQGIAVLDLTESNPTRCGFQYFNQKIVEPLGKREGNSYQPCAAGTIEARQAVARYYRNNKLSIPPQNLVLTAGTSEAYSFVFRLLLNPDERVLVPAPSYPLFQYLARINDVEVNYYPLYFEGNWHIDTDVLEDLVDEKTRCIILVNPNNPTGSFVKSGELKRINEICRQREVAVICDEVFLDYSFESQRPLSLMGNQEVLTFVLGGISKSLGLPQMKLAWIALNGPVSLVEQAKGRLEVIADTFLSVNTPSQNALAAWMALYPQIHGEIFKRLTDNLEFLAKEWKNLRDSQLLPVEGGWYAVIQLPSGTEEETFVLELLEKDRVFVHPGYFFDFARESYVVLSLLTPPDIFKEGIRRILVRLAEHRQ